jgi:ligand-binding sensor domain-containing protein/anti-sigma regulatory factor (Ser/Thr protein kinase)
MNYPSHKPLLPLIACLTLLSLSSLFLFAQPETVKYERFTTEDGLSSNVVYCSFQDKYGYLWVATNDGLNRYDGYTFKTYRQDPNDSSSIPSNSITMFCEDGDGNLWVNTSAGLCRYERKEDNFKRVIVSGKTAFLQMQINNHEILVVTSISYHKLNTRNLQATMIEIPKLIKDFYRGNSAYRSSDNKIYIAFNRDDSTVILKYEPSKNAFVVFLRFTGKPKVAGSVRVFFRDSRNWSWFGLATDGGLLSLAPNKSVITDLKNWDLEEKVKTVNHIYEDRQGFVWISTTQSLFRFNHLSNKLEEFSYHVPAGVNNTNLTNSVFEDRSGLIWISGYNGLFKLEKVESKFSQLIKKPDRSGLIDNFVLGLFRSNGSKVWINYQWGVPQYSLFDLESKSIRHFIFASNSLNYARDAWVQDPHLTDESQVNQWIADHSPPRALPQRLLIDRSGKLWIFTANDLGLPGGDNVLKTNSFLMDARIIDNDIWVVTDGDGLQSVNTETKSVSYYRFRKGENSLNSNNLLCLLPEKNGNLWIGTKGNGLNYFDRAKNTFHHYTTLNGMSSNTVFSLVKDDKGRLWIGTSNGLSCFDPSSGNFRNFSPTDGLVNSEYNRYSACHLSNGYIVMGGLDGIDFFHPDSVLTTPFKSQIQITDFKVLNKAIHQSSSIKLKHKQNYITIDFATMDFRNPTTNKYEYKMEGIDKEWVSAGTQHSVSYASLPPGRYRFLVRSLNSDGSHSYEPAQISFSIITPWWRTGWFLSLSAILILSGIFSIYQFRIRQLKKLIRVRTRISQDLHDEVGATLTSISFLSEVVKQQTGNGQSPAHETIEKIGEFSREMIGEMNDIVWAINPTNDKLEKIENRMQNFASPLLAAKNIRFNFHSDGQIKSLSLGMQQRKNLYLIFKEAVNNSAKYAGCKEVNVAIFRENNHIQMEITDDGKGFSFDQENGNRGGNGLKNMKERAVEINAGFSINSVPGGGTSIVIKVPITQNAY